MDNDMHELAALQQQYAAAQARKRKRKIRIIIGILIFAVIMTSVCVYLFKRIPWSAEDLDVEAVVEDGVVWVYANGAQSGGKVYGRFGKSTFADMDTKSEVYYTDYENLIWYTDYHIRFEDSRWGLLVHPVRRGVQKVYTDGRDVATIYESHLVIVENGTEYHMSARYARLVYDNPDGTSVSVWKCEGISK